MRNIWLKLIVIICIGTIAPEGVGFDYPGDDSIGKASIPQAGTSGLIRKPQINYGAIGDIVVSGSLPNGNYFQGIVPYNSTSELSILQGTLGSSLLNSGSIGSTGRFCLLHKYRRTVLCLDCCLTTTAKVVEGFLFCPFCWRSQ